MHLSKDREEHMRILKIIMFLFVASALLSPITSEAKGQRHYLSYTNELGQTVKLPTMTVGGKTMVLVPLEKVCGPGWPNMKDCHLN
jgi:hypothetical protein